MSDMHPRDAASLNALFRTVQMQGHAAMEAEDKMVRQAENLRTVSDQLKSTQEQLAKAQAEFDEVSLEATSLLGDIDKIREAFEAEKAALESALNERVDQVLELTEKVTELRECTNTAVANLNDEQLENGRLKKEIEDLEASNVGLGSLLDEKEAIIKQLRQQIEDRDY